jgi:hypothetical protein
VGRRAPTCDIAVHEARRGAHRENPVAGSTENEFSSMIVRASPNEEKDP